MQIGVCVFLFNYSKYRNNLFAAESENNICNSICALFTSVKPAVNFLKFYYREVKKIPEMSSKRAIQYFA